MSNVKMSSLEWDVGGHARVRRAPRRHCEQTGLTLGFLSDMLLRTLYVRGGMLGLDLAGCLCLPFKVIEESLGFLKHEKCIEVLGGDLIGRISYRFNLTELGRRRAQEAFKMCAYVGPAPVPLEDYVEQTYRQAVTAIDVSPEALRAAFSHLVISEDLFNAVGPAIVSGKSVFIYGPPGNGKTSIAQAIGNFMNTSGGEIYVPFAFLAESNIITLYDNAVHERGDGDDDDRMEDNEATIRRLLNTGTVDQRWVRDQAARDRHRRRTEPEHARPEVQRRGQLLPGAAARQGQRRRLPDRRLRPATVQSQGTAQSLDRAAGKPASTTCRWRRARSSRCRSSS